VPPLDNVKLFKFNVAVEVVQLAPVKSSLLNQLLVVKVAVAVPLVIDRGNALNVLPPVVPNVYVLVIDASETNPPVTVE
jgi:hypothetical protein